MSNPTPRQNGFQTFIKGYWEIPTERPNFFHSFLRGAILSVILSFVFLKTEGPVEVVVWAVLVGLIWMAVDNWAWKSHKKRKGA